MNLSFSYYDMGTKVGRDQFAIDEADILRCLQTSIPEYYGDNYHRRRTIADQSHVVIVREVYSQSHDVCGVTYIKPYGRRALLCVDPEHRRKGLGRALIKESLKYVPRQYSIIWSSNMAVLELLTRNGFRPVDSELEARRIAVQEEHLLFNFRERGGYVVFDRRSESRYLVKSSLRMLQCGYDVKGGEIDVVN